MQKKKKRIVCKVGLEAANQKNAERPDNKQVLSVVYGVVVHHQVSKIPIESMKPENSIP